MYTPQFAYARVEQPCDDQRCMYSFDRTNLPVFNTLVMAPGARTGRIPLKLDKDADFYLRGISQEGLISIRLEDTDGNALSDCENVIEPTNYEDPSLYSDTSQGGLGFGIVVLDSGAGGVFGPAGGNFVAYLFNNTANSIELVSCAINLHGVKRYHEEVCKQ